MSTPPDRRPGQRPPTTTERRRREPLFPLEDDDIAPRRLPPQPLADILDDDMLPGLSEQQARNDRRTAPPGGSRRREEPVARPEARTERSDQAASARTRPLAQPDRPLPQPARTRPPVAPRTPSASPARPAQATRPLAEGAAMLQRARTGLEEAEADLLRSDLIGASYRPYRQAPASAGMPSPLLLGIIATVSVVILILFGGERVTDMSRWSLPNPMPLFGVEEEVVQQLAGPANPVGDYRLQGPPSLTPDQIDRILSSYGSPATGTGAVWYELGIRRGIDPAFAVAFFIHESGAGTARNWAGLKPDGSTTHNVGNIICAGYATCYNRFRDYPSWEDGIADWYRLIDVEYIKGRGTLTLEEIIPIYAPSFENDVGGYVNTVARLVDSWRRGEVP